MLKIRLQRVGRKHSPSFRLVLTDSQNSTKSGRFNEILGSYDPRKTNEALNGDRIKHWISMGAGLTGSVSNLLIKKGLIKGKKTHVGADNVVPAPVVVEEKAPEVAPEPEVVAEAPAEAPVEAPVVETPVEPVVEAPVETPVEAPAPEEAPAA